MWRPGHGRVSASLGRTAVPHSDRGRHHCDCCCCCCSAPATLRWLDPESIVAQLARRRVLSQSQSRWLTARKRSHGNSHRCHSPRRLSPRRRPPDDSRPSTWHSLARSLGIWCSSRLHGQAAAAAATAATAAAAADARTAQPTGTAGLSQSQQEPIPMIEAQSWSPRPLCRCRLLRQRLSWQQQRTASDSSASSRHRTSSDPHPPLLRLPASAHCAFLLRQPSLQRRLVSFVCCK